MPSATEPQDTLQREKGQRGIDSFFKSPKSNVKDKKDLFSYFKKVDTSPDQTNGKGCVKSSNLDKEKTTGEVVDISENENDTTIDVDIVSEESEAEEVQQVASPRETECTTESHNELKVTEVSEEKSKPIKESGPAKCNAFAFMMANRNKQNEVLKNMKEQEENVNGSDSAPSLNDGNPAEKCGEGSKNKEFDENCGEESNNQDSDKKCETEGSKQENNGSESSNMQNTTEKDKQSNRKDIEKKKRKIKPKNVPAKSSVSESSKERCEELEVIIQKDAEVPPKPKVNKISPTFSGANAFAFLMANRHKQDKGLSDCEASNNEGEIKESVGDSSSEKGKKSPSDQKRKKRKDLDSSLADFDITEEEQEKGNKSVIKKPLKKRKAAFEKEMLEVKTEKETKSGSCDTEISASVNGHEENGSCDSTIMEQSKVNKKIKPSESRIKEEKSDIVQDSEGGNMEPDNARKLSKGKNGKKSKPRKQKGLNPIDAVKQEPQFVQPMKMSKANDDAKIESAHEDLISVGKLKDENRNEKKTHIDAPAVEPEIQSVSLKDDVETIEPPKKRRRKKVNYEEESLDGDEGKLQKNVDTDENDASNVSEVVPENSKKRNISTFFKKITKEERAVERSKNTFTIKADVHASNDGGKEAKPVKPVPKKKNEIHAVADKENLLKNSGDNNERRVSRRIKKRQEIEELDKIELLEQITPTNSPMKLSSNNFNNIMKELPRKIELIQEAVTKIEAETKSVSSKKLGKKATEIKVLQDIGDQCTKEEDKHSKDENKITKQEPTVNEGSTEEKEIMNRPKRKLSKKSSSSPSNAEGEETKTKKPGKAKPKVPTESPPEADVTMDEIFPKRKNVSQARSMNSSVQDTETDTDTSITSRRKSQRVRNGISSESLNTSEDDKENAIQYTSTLIQTPGRLSLRLKRVQPTVKTKARGRRSLSLRHNNTPERKPAHTKARELVQKAKDKISPKRRGKRLSLSRTKKKSFESDVIDRIADQHVVEVNMVTVESDIAIDDSTNTPVKPTNKKKRQLKLKPSCASTPKAKTVAKKNMKTKKVTKSKNVSEEVIVIDEPAGETSRRSSRKAAVNAKKIMEEQKEVEEIVEKPKKSEKEKTVKDAKLAPIFFKKKVNLSPSKLKARQDFLQSGVPDQIKKQVYLEKCQEEEACEWPPFPAISHIQQKSDANLWTLSCPKIKNLKEITPNISSPIEKRILSYDIMSVLKDKYSTKLEMGKSSALDLASIVAILVSLKKENPHFPVFSVFKSYLELKRDSVNLYKKELEKEEAKIKVIDLEEEEEEASKGKGKRKRRSKGSAGTKRKRLSGAKGKKIQEEDKDEDCHASPLWHERTPHVWAQVFSPKNTSQVIGNTGHIRKMKMWLQEWKRKAEIYANKEKNKKKKTFRRDDDFMVSDESSGFGDDDDFVNTFLLCGPPGVGKTSAVYALATELGYKVLEVNASSRRPGQHVRSQLAEATQSHSVSSNTSQQPTNTLTAMFAAKAAGVKPLAKKVFDNESQNSNSDAEGKKKVALVLFEDLDIVFEEWDEGFMAAVNNFMATSKRPIILTLSHASANVISKIKGNYEKLIFSPPAEDLIAHHLQLIGLVNGHHICYDDVQSLVNVNKCDVRQSLHDLQFWTMSGSSGKACDCLAVHKAECLLDGNAEENSSYKPAKDLKITDIFPEAEQIDTQHVKLYQSKLWEKLQAKSLYDDKVDLNCDRRNIPLQKLKEADREVSWSQIASNLPLLLPLPLTEEEKTKHRYPLQPDDPLIKTTHLWERHNWLSLDEDEEEPSKKEVTEETKQEEKESKDKVELPPHIQKSSRQCLESMADLYSTLAQLDILESCEGATSDGNKERGWWTRHPTAGISTELSNHDHYWAPHKLTIELTQFLGESSMKYCQEKLVAALPDESLTEWPQLSLKIHSNMKSPSLIPHIPKANSIRQEQQAITKKLTSYLPTINQLNRNISVDYIPCIRSFIRFDEIGAAISKNRRGRRFLSHLAHLGIHLSAEEKLKLANAFLS